MAVSFPHTGLVNQGPQLGPLTPAFGDLVQTPKGLRSIALEGFSEDLDQDGYVDPVGQATVPVAAPVAVAHSVAPFAVAHAAPAYTYAAAPAAVAAPAYAYNSAAPLAAAPVAVAAPTYTYNYAAPVAAAVHSHTPVVHAVAPAATVPLAPVHSHTPVVHAPLPAVAHAAVHHHGGCVNNFGAIVHCAL